jgi:hypothetical protein
MWAVREPPIQKTFLRLNHPDLSEFLLITCIKLLGPVLLTVAIPTKIYKTKAKPAKRLKKFQ